MNFRAIWALWVISPALLLLSGCAPAPIYKATPGTTSAMPMQVAQTPERYGKSAVIWGGSVIDVHNFPDHSEMEVLAYPLDSSQRPETSAQASGRFIALFHGYLEPLNYRNGTLITVTGQISGSRAGTVDRAPYIYPLVDVAQSHVWTSAEMRKGHPDVHFGLGVGMGIP